MQFSFLMQLVFGIAVLHAKVFDIHRELDEERESFCITRRSYHLGSGQSLASLLVSTSGISLIPFYFFEVCHVAFIK